MTDLTFEHLLTACSPGGSSCLTYTTELVPAGGAHASIAPAKYVAARGGAAFAYERRYLDGQPRDAVVVDSKQSQNNRLEHRLLQAVRDGDGPLSGLPHLEVVYGDGERYTDLDLPHRAYDGHVRAGTVDEVPTTQTEQYRLIRNASPANARALLDASPVTLLLGGWDSSRRSRQGRWRSLLVGEIMGFLPGPAQDGTRETQFRGGARVDPVGMQVQVDGATMKSLVAAQRQELSPKLQEKLTKESDSAVKSGKPVSASPLGLGGIPPTLEQLAGVSCDRIIRSRVLSFAGLRQIRFGAGSDGDVACRALLAAFAVAGVARADSELDLRANCDLREAGPVSAELDLRGGELRTLTAPGIAEADVLLDAALAHAREVAGVSWDGVALSVVGNPSIIRGAQDDTGEESAS